MLKPPLASLYRFSLTRFFEFSIAIIPTFSAIFGRGFLSARALLQFYTVDRSMPVAELCLKNIAHTIHTVLVFQSSDQKQRGIRSCREQHDIRPVPIAGNQSVTSRMLGRS